MDASGWRDLGAVHRLGDLDVFYRRAGSGPSLVCLHGFPTSSIDFEPLWADLTSRFDVVAHDLIGLGWSAKPRRPLPVALQADVTLGLCEALGVTEAHLLAHDLGDTVAQELLARVMDGDRRVRWRSCTLLNGGLFPETHRPRLIQRLLISPLGGLVAQLTSERRFRWSFSAVFGPDTQPSEAFLKDAWQLAVRDGGRAALPRLIRYMAERRTHRERWVRPLVERVVPTRVIDGALDPISGRHMVERYRELVPEPDTVLLEHVGHYPHVEDPPAVLAPFLEHVERVERHR